MTKAKEILLLRNELIALRKENADLRAEIVILKQLLQEALDKLNKNSGNSSKPPSSDIVRTKSLRSPSGKKAGGQPGHKGSRLAVSNHVDNIIVHSAKNCKDCGKDISGIGSMRYERRQVYDIPPMRLKVTEHRSEIKCCLHCGCKNSGGFPAGISHPVQYGDNIKQLGVYLSQYQLLPYKRSAEMIKDITGHCISEGTLVNFNTACSNQISGFIDELKAHILKAAVVHFDETGYYYANHRNWLHVAATTDSTYYYAHEKRGRKAMDEMDILPHCTADVMHDYWKSYLDYHVRHNLCNVHHVRDLTFCAEQEKSNWAAQMKVLLLDMKQGVDDCHTQKWQSMPASMQEQYLQQFDALLQQGHKEHPIPQKQAGKRGSVKKSKSANLVERFSRHKEDIVRFIKNFGIPFGNNLAEQAIRMMKVKQKISGCFRSKEGATLFANIRSYIDTMRKNEFRIMDALGLAMKGTPIIPFS